jgi:hypothetical protein
MRPVLRRRTLLAVAIAAMGLTVSVQAESLAPALVELEVVDRETGDAARVWRHAGRMFVAGQPGARYSLRVSNNTPGRVLAVMSVDGVNILTGETAGYGQRGYVLGPYESYDVAGWRKSDTEIAAFTFAPLRRSYAARTGRPQDVGVIGVAAFTERAYPPLVSAPVAPQSRGRVASDSADEAAATGSRARAAPATAAPPPAVRGTATGETMARSERLGTGHGAREWSAVRSVRFERVTSYPQYVQRLEYDSHDNLVAAGVIPRRRPVPPRPRPFPSSPERNGYVPDPPGGR